ncbi:hypothetical protein [Archaeoglobus sp.]
MLRKILPILLVLFLIQTASAQIVKFEMTPQTLLPNDIADCKLTFTAQQNTYISGITIFHPTEVDVSPDSFSGIGWLYAGQSYDFYFTIKAEKSGIYTLTICIDTLNGTIKQPLTIRVVNQMPDIILDKTVLTLNEVNDVLFTITSPIDVSNVVVKPLFNANPKVIYVQNGKGSFKFEPKKTQPLKFKICFYNGKNYHEVVRTVKVSYVQSKGVLINVTSKYPVALIGDVVPIDVEIANLRGDTIYNVNVTVFGGIFSKNNVQIPIVKPGESTKVSFDFCSRSGGLKKIEIKVQYEDEFNNLYEDAKFIEIKVLNETSLQFSGLEIKTSLGGLTVTGDVSNNGRTKVYNVFVVASTSKQTKTYYIDSLDPSDFDTFEFNFANYTGIVTLKVKWTNEIGEIFETTKVVKIPSQELHVKAVGGVNYLATAVSLAVLVFVIAIIVLSWKRRR